MLKGTSILVVLIALVMMALPAIAFETPRNAGDSAFHDLVESDNLTTGYPQQNQYDPSGNYWVMYGFYDKFYPSIGNADEGFVLVKTDNSIVALWAIKGSWSLTNDTAALERLVGAQALDLTGITHVKIINASLTPAEYGTKIVLFARDEAPLDITVEELDQWVREMTTEMDQLKSQFSIAFELDNNWIWDAGYETVLDAPEMELDGTHTMSRSIRNTPSIPEYPMWQDEPDYSKPSARASGLVSIEGYALDFKDEGYGCGGAQPVKKEGWAYVPDGNCPSEDNQNYVTLFNNDTIPRTMDGWTIQWDQQNWTEENYEEWFHLNGIEVTRFEFTIDSLTLQPGEKMNYPVDYQGSNPTTPYSTIKLFNETGKLVDEWGKPCDAESMDPYYWNAEPVEVSINVTRGEVHIPYVKV